MLAVGVWGGAYNREGEISNFSFQYRHSDHTSLLHGLDLVLNKPSKYHLHCHYVNYCCLETVHWLVTPAGRTKELRGYSLGKVKDSIGRYVI
jgi:hypothetical protein